MYNIKEGDEDYKVMNNLIKYKITLPEDVIRTCWNVLESRYLLLENKLPATFHNRKLNKNIHPTGAFMISLDELVEVEDTILKRTFIQNGTSPISIRQNDTYILRGKSYFPNINNVKTVNKELLNTLELELKLFLNTLLEISPKENVLLYLALLDNMKNHCLIVLYAINQIQREICDIQNLKLTKNAFFDYISAVQDISDAFWASYEKQAIIFPIFCNNLNTVIEPPLAFLKEKLESIANHKHIVNKIFRNYRENNNPIKLSRLGWKVSGKYLPRKTLLIGTEYGGIELPFLVNSYRKMRGKETMEIVLLSLSNYSLGIKTSPETILGLVSPYFSSEKLNYTDTVLILDDSITTGRTIESLKSLLPENIERIYLACVSFKVTNRYHHLTMKNHGGVNPKVVENSIFVCKSNYATTYSTNTYTDENGVFDLDKSEIKQLIELSY